MTSFYHNCFHKCPASGYSHILRSWGSAYRFWGDIFNPEDRPLPQSVPSPHVSDGVLVHPQKADGTWVRRNAQALRGEAGTPPTGVSPTQGRCAALGACAAGARNLQLAQMFFSERASELKREAVDLRSVRGNQGLTREDNFSHFCGVEPFQ